MERALIATDKSFGVVYFVDQNPDYRRMMRTSIRSLKKFHPDWPVEILECPSTYVPLWKQLVRWLSFWRWKRRRNRLNQDRYIFRLKANALLSTPFDYTLFLDVDTVVRRPLDDLRARAMDVDAMFTAMPWKQYPRIAPDLPESIPFVMSGVFFYNKRFADACRPYVDRFGAQLHDIVDGTLLGDQFIFSLACVVPDSGLKIAYEPTLQIDVINAAHHLGTADYPRVGNCIEITYDGLIPFHVFHYNEFKPQYLHQIRRVWDLSVD